MDDPLGISAGMKFAPFILIVLSLLGLWALYEFDRRDCASRGGHVEAVHGGNGGWICLDGHAP